MKKTLQTLLVISALASLVGCSANNSSKTSSNQSLTTSSSELDSSETSSEAISSISSIKNSSSAISSSAPSYKENELSTASGLVVKFKSLGASIDSIQWGNTKIAKDGFTVGRCANRIAGGKFSLDGKEYTLSKNDGANHLHGGTGSGMNSWRGPFATKEWTKVSQTDSTITFSFHSADGDQGYPGNMDMTVKYSLSQEGELAIEYTATSDKDTLCNPTNHLFMAINGNTSYSNINLQINAENYTPLSNSIPTGAISPVAGTKFDYRNETAFKGSESYDDNYVLDGSGYRKVATMSGTTSKIKVEVFTDRPGLQLYKDGSGNICLETQMFPDMINHPEFASYGTTVLKANETFTSKTAYTFSKIA